MKIPLTYGVLMAVAGAVLTLLLYFAGLHDSVEKMSSAQWIGALGGIAIGVTSLMLAMGEKRARFPADEAWGYGSALGVGILTGLVGSLLSGIFAYLYFAVLNPTMSDLMAQSQLAAMEAKGMTSAQIDRAEPMMRKWMSPGVLTVLQTFMGFVWCVCLALILAIFMRKRRTSVGDTPPPLAG